MNAEETVIIEKAAVAHEKQNELIRCKVYSAANFLRMGELLKDFRDESLWKLLGHDSWEAFLGSPEISLGRSWAYDLIRVYEVFVIKLKREYEDIVSIDISKLVLAAHHEELIKQDPDEWMAKARSLSKSDLSLEIKGQGPGDKISLSPPIPASALPPEAPCAICGVRPTEKSHFPVTRGAGAGEDEWMPMCRDCHSGFHAGPERFITTYKRNWGKWFYSHLDRGE